MRVEGDMKSASLQSILTMLTTRTWMSFDSLFSISLSLSLSLLIFVKWIREMLRENRTGMSHLKRLKVQATNRLRWIIDHLHLIFVGISVSWGRGDGGGGGDFVPAITTRTDAFTRDRSAINNQISSIPLNNRPNAETIPAFLTSVAIFNGMMTQWKVMMIQDQFDNHRLNR